MSRRCTGPAGPYHDYEDLSCCHDLIPQAVVADLARLLRDMRSNDYPNGNEYAAFLDRIDAVLGSLGEHIEHIEQLPHPALVRDGLDPQECGECGRRHR